MPPTCPERLGLRPSRSVAGGLLGSSAASITTSSILWKPRRTSRARIPVSASGPRVSPPPDSTANRVILRRPERPASPDEPCRARGPGGCPDFVHARSPDRLSRNRLVLGFPRPPPADRPESSRSPPPPARPAYRSKALRLMRIPRMPPLVRIPLPRGRASGRGASRARDGTRVSPHHERVDTRATMDGGGAVCRDDEPMPPAASLLDRRRRREGGNRSFFVKSFPATRDSDYCPIRRAKMRELSG